MGKGEHIRSQAAPAPEAPKHRKKSDGRGRKFCAKADGPCVFGPWEVLYNVHSPDLVRYCTACRRKRTVTLYRWGRDATGKQVEYLGPGYGRGWRWKLGEIEEGW